MPRDVHHFKYKTLELYLNETGFDIERILYPSTIFSGMRKTTKVMRENGVGVCDIFIKVVKVVFAKTYYRLFVGYRFDAGIVVLAKKVI
ncbi:MAG: hypothetical protein AB1393_00770 [Candidatus Edwardsbacteria bacterium]